MEPTIAPAATTAATLPRLVEATSSGVVTVEEDHASTAKPDKGVPSSSSPNGRVAPPDATLTVVMTSRVDDGEEDKVDVLPRARDDICATVQDMSSTNASKHPPKPETITTPSLPSATSKVQKETTSPSLDATTNTTSAPVTPLSAFQNEPPPSETEPQPTTPAPTKHYVNLKLHPTSSLGRYECNSYAPTLEELQSQSFSDYVRYTVLRGALPRTVDDDESSDDWDSDDEPDWTLGDQDPLTLTQGIAKVILPPGFCSERGIGNDRTGRGLAWQTRQQQQQQSIHTAPVVREEKADTRPEPDLAIDIQNALEKEDKEEKAENHSSTKSHVDSATTVHVKQNASVAADTTLAFCVATSEEMAASQSLTEQEEEEPAASDTDESSSPLALGDMVITNPIEQHLRGLAGVYEYTLVDKGPVTVDEFRKRADAYRKNAVGCAFEQEQTETGDDSSDKDGPPEPPETKEEKEEEEERRDGYNSERLNQLERTFWRRLGPTMPPAWYGADQEGSFFGGDEASGWSVAELDSCLSVLPGRGVPGVTTPYLYVGMWGAVFCAHTEDMNLLSINYLHAGAPKIWYAIAPGSDSKRFEALCESHFATSSSAAIHTRSSGSSSPSKAKKPQYCKEYMRHKRSLLSPKVLQRAGIRYVTTVQWPGEAVITFPAAYHFGFNAGFNVAEATNFGVPEWIPYGRQANVCLCRPDSVRIDMGKLVHLIHMYQVDKDKHDRRRGRKKKELTWKTWSEERERKKQQKLLEEEEREKRRTVAQALTLLNGSPSKKKRKEKQAPPPSEQQRKNEFWVEVVKPVTKKNKATKKGTKRKAAEDELPTGKRKRKLSSKAAALLEEQEIKRRAKEKVIPSKEIWHLAKPIVRKRLERRARVLCMLPGTVMGLDAPMNGEDIDDDEEEQCFAGEIVEISDDHVLVHIDGLPRTEDTWMPLTSPKLFFDGGRWEELEESHEIPARHFWKEMDSKDLC